MKKIYFLFIGILSFSCLYAQGFNSSFAVIDANGSVGDYCMYSNTSCGANGSLDGQNFGSFTEGSSALTLRGVKFNLYKCSGQDINTPTLYYRVYPSGSPSGSFSSFTSGITSYPANGCGGEDQTWNDISKNVNLLTGLNPGDYVLEVYCTANVYNGGWSTAYLSNNSNNYKATFTVSSSLAVGDINKSKTSSFFSEGKLYTSQKGNLDIQVYDFSGKLVKKVNANNVSSGLELNLPKKGNYLVKVNNEVVKIAY